MKTNLTIVIAEILIVASVALFVLNISRIFPMPLLPEEQQISAATVATVGNGSLTIVEFSDFECPFCAEASRVVDQLGLEYGSRVDLEFKHFPLHKNSEKAAEASECARDQGTFWAYHDILFSHQDALGVENLKQYASDIGLGLANFSACLDSGEKSSVVKADYAEAIKLGVRGTPTFVVANQTLEGVHSLSEFQRLIDSAIGTS
jgi:protein-disulfide isomerase